jgi:hypothetical protein
VQGTESVEKDGNRIGAPTMLGILRSEPPRQPLTQVRRHQERLLAITRDEPVRHPGIALNRSDGIVDLRDSAVENNHFSRRLLRVRWL